MSKLTEEMWAKVVARVDELKSLPYSKLAIMPHYSEVENTCNGVPIRVATWIDKGKDQLGIAVHTIKEGILGSETIAHDGFFINPDGSIKQMPSERQLKNV